MAARHSSAAIIISLTVMKSNEKENLDPLHLISGDKQWPKVHDEEGKQISILFEYKLVQLYGPLFGIYVMPQLDDIYSNSPK